MEEEMRIRVWIFHESMLTIWKKLPRKEAAIIKTMDKKIQIFTGVTISHLMTINLQIRQWSSNKMQVYLINQMQKLHLG